MDWVDKLNQWAMKSIRPHPIKRVETDQEGSTLIRTDSSQFIRWSDIQQIAALKQPALAKGSFALAIQTGGSMVAVIDDTVPGYAEFCQELPRKLRGAAPYQEWAVELTSATLEIGKVIFQRSAR
jgi:hypothetical protein